MTDLIWLMDEQVQWMELHFPLSHGLPYVDDRRVLSGIVFVIQNGLRWRDAPSDYGRTRPYIIASFARAVWVFLTASSRTWRHIMLLVMSP